MSADTITRAAERDLADMQAAYDAHVREHVAGEVTAKCSRCVSFKDHIARCERQLTLLSDDAEPEQDELF